MTHQHNHDHTSPTPPPLRPPSLPQPPPLAPEWTPTYTEKEDDEDLMPRYHSDYQTNRSGAAPNDPARTRRHSGAGADSGVGEDDAEDAPDDSDNTQFERMDVLEEEALPDEPTHWYKPLTTQLNFYRIHLLFFTFTPILWSGIFYASNGEFKISYVDSLFNCVSSITVTGLATVNLSSLTPWQQSILFIQMCLGSPVLVSWVMVFIRRYYFRRKLTHVIAADAARRAEEQAIKAELQGKPPPTHWRAFFRGRQLSVEPDTQSSPRKGLKGGVMQKLRTDMIRRVDERPKLVNPSGWVSDESAQAPPNSQPASATPAPPVLSHHRRSIIQATNPTRSPLVPHNPAPEHSILVGSPQNPTSSISIELTPSIRRPRRGSDPGRPSRPSSPTSAMPMQRSETLAVSGTPPASPKRFPRVPTVEFAPAPRRPTRSGKYGIPDHEQTPQVNHYLSPDLRSAPSRRASTTITGPVTSIYTQTAPSHQTARTTQTMRSAKHRGYGGFPMPFSLINRLVTRLFPKLKNKLQRTITIPMTTSLVPTPTADPHAKQVPYLSFTAVVGRNSTFHLLTSDQLEEIGGVEYRALNALLWIVGAYHIGIQLISFAVIAPYMSLSKWHDTFEPPQQLRPVDSTWFSAYQVVSAYTNTGMSLVDQSMLPFQTAYPMIVFMMFLILAGNTCFPIFLRFMIWTMTKFVNRRGRLGETLHFLLDHPRRCFIYLFPSHQTWFLLTIVVTLSLIDFIFFIALDINNPLLSSISKGTLIFDGILQALAVRAAGFGIVPLAALAPAVKVLFVVMMYISVYPVAMSVRSTNVYEEQTLGIFTEEADEERDFQPHGPRMTVWGKYLGLHARKQLAFDMWWLALALFLICWIEDSRLQDPANASWFNVFNIIFEIVSGYGTVGLSLGLPDQNYSFSGSFKTLSKLILCLVMLRGRHRGLPIAIDRAIMLPSEFGRTEEPKDHPGEILSVGGSTAHRVPFRYSETMGSHPGSDIHYRSRRPARRSEDNLYHLEEQAHESSSDTDSHVTHKG